MTELMFSPDAHWIWGSDDQAPRNIWRYFRQTFMAPDEVKRATLLLTADSRYEAKVNGTHLGRGPIRGLPFNYFYDVYDVTSFVRPGQMNVVSVFVNFLNDHTMTYIRGKAGLLAEIVLEDAAGMVTRVGTDAHWRTRPCPAISADVPRMCVQMDFEEQYDARQMIEGWENVTYDDGDWPDAIVVGAIGCEPWISLSPRPIPFLTEDPVVPISIKAVELARPAPGLMWHLDLREYTQSMRTGFRTSPTGERGSLVFTEVIAPFDCEITVHAFANYENIDLRVNDNVFTPFDSSTVVKLHRGANLVMMRNVDWPTLLFETDVPLTLKADRFEDGAAWIFCGPFDENSNEAEQYWSVNSLDELPSDLPRIGIPQNANRLDVAALTMNQHFFSVDGGFCAHEIAGPQPRLSASGVRANFVDSPVALLHDNLDWMIIHPQHDGDTHVVVDFGRELIGYLRFDVDAPAGTIIDANLFEGIDHGGIFWMERTRNSMRYTCRDGRQTFTSHIRRGFRYVSLTFRNMTGPVRVRHVDTLLSTYPVEAQGSFRCSDETLNRIWEVAAYTVRLCMLDTYVDCPAYEQVYWVGDARNSALVNAIAFGAYPLTKHCVQLSGQSLSDKMSIVKSPYLDRPHLVTSHGVSGWFNEIPMWTFLWVWMAWEYYWQTSDTAALADFYDDVRECLRRAEGFLSERDLLAIPEVWNLFDWSANDLESTGEIVGNTVLFARSFDYAAQMAQILNRSETEIEELTTLAQRLRDAVNQHGWSDEHGGYVDTVRDATAYAVWREPVVNLGVGVTSSASTFDEFQSRLRISEQTNTLAMLCEAVPPERYEDVLRFVMAATKGEFESSAPMFAGLGSSDQVVPVGSPWFLFFTLEAMIGAGYASDAIALIREQWNRMLTKGATTFWETFPGKVGSGGHGGDHWSRSLCHGWSAAPAYFLSTQVLGVTPLEPGYRRVQIAPQPCDLQWASGVVPTPHGPITVEWYIDPSQELIITYDAPNACEVEVLKPDLNTT